MIEAVVIIQLNIYVLQMININLV